jgi:hypothetical protein
MQLFMYTWPSASKHILNSWSLNPALCQPFTTAAFLPLFSCYYALTVLAILPHTYIFKLSLLPIIIWQTWYCAVVLIAQLVWHDPWDSRVQAIPIASTLAIWYSHPQAFIILLGMYADTMISYHDAYCKSGWNVDPGAEITGMGIHLSQDILPYRSTNHFQRVKTTSLSDEACPS